MPQPRATENDHPRLESPARTRPMKAEAPTPSTAMAEPTSPKHSPTSVKSRSLPSTPSQRPQSPHGGRRSPSALIRRLNREASPPSLRTSASRTPPTYRRGVMCQYETGMKQARRRVPYTLGPERLDPDPAGASKKLSAKEEFRITTDMNSLYRQLLPTEESEERRRRLVAKLERLLRDRWPGQTIKVSVFGSTGNKLGTNDSDVDICITTDCKEVEHVCSIADLLARNGMERVVCVSSAKVPIVKVWDPDLHVACDMNVNNPIALQNTELIRSYVAIDDRFRPLAMIVKHWAKRRILNDAALGGTLSSYTWICLVLNFLQTRDPPILPTLQRTHLKPHLVGGVNVAFDTDLSRYEGFGTANPSSLGSLLFQFFHYYGHELDFETSVVSVRLGQVIPKSQKAWHLLQDNRLCVEEPFNITRNLGNTADDTSVRGIHLELRRACDLIAAGHFDACCEQYDPPQAEPQPRRTDTFVPPTTKAIIPQPPPQPPPHPPRQAKNKNKNGPRGDRMHAGTRRASNPPGRAPSQPPYHLRDLPFQMTPHELQIQAQHQQHLLHDQLFQQYQYLQMQEQELRLQLIRHRGLVAASGYSSSGLSGADSMDDGQESSVSSRTNASARVPLTAPLYQSRFNTNPSRLSNGIASSGIVTNPASPLLNTALPDSRRYTRRASVHHAAANTLRAQSQPARSVPPPLGLPYLSQRFEVPVRQVPSTGTRRSSINSTPADPLGAYLAGRMSQQGTRYDAGRRPVEYVGYFVGQSPSGSAYPGSATVSPVPSHAGLAIHNGGLSPRMSARASRAPSVATSPASHHASLANGTSIMTPVNENGPAPDVPVAHSPPPSSSFSGPLIVDGSVNSPPRRQPMTRPARSASDDLDVSVSTSEDAALDTPPSSDEFAHGSGRKPVNGGMPGHDAYDVMQERDFLSLNGTSGRFAEPTGYDQAETAALLRKIEDERRMRELTTALAAATVNNGPPPHVGMRKMEPHPFPMTPTGPPLAQMTNGNHASPSYGSGPHEWQTQTKKKKRNKKAKQDPHDNGATAGPSTVAASEMERGG